MYGATIPDFCIGCKNLKPSTVTVQVDGRLNYRCTKCVCLPENASRCLQFDPHPYFESQDDDGSPD
jgi:hypothetical protein